MSTILASSLTPQQWGIGALALAAWLLPARWRRKRRSRPSLYRRVLWYPNARRRRDFTDDQRWDLYVGANGRCYYCALLGADVVVHYGTKCHWLDGCDTDFEADHYIPYSKGGPTTLANGRVSCRYHNRLKGDQMPDEFMALLSAGALR